MTSSRCGPAEEDVQQAMAWLEPWALSCLQIKVIIPVSAAAALCSCVTPGMAACTAISRYAVRGCTGGDIAQHHPLKVLRTLCAAPGHFSLDTGDVSTFSIADTCLGCREALPEEQTPLACETSLSQSLQEPGPGLLTGCSKPSSCLCCFWGFS